MRSEPDLCDSNFVHIGAAREQKLGARARLLQDTNLNSRLALANPNHTSQEIRLVTGRIFAFPKVPTEAEQRNILHTTAIRRWKGGRNTTKMLDQEKPSGHTTKAIRSESKRG